MFPRINRLNDLLPFITGNSQFRVAEQSNGFTVACYMVKDEDTFRGEHAFWYQECRGITFDREGRVAARTLHKFPNVGEDADSQPDLIPWADIVRIMDKRDGSMITPVLVDDQIVCKTKKTFTSAEAIEATKLLNADPKKVEWVRNMLRAGVTPTFEWTSPRFPIVLLYEKDELTLLQIRHNVSGKYFVDELCDPVFIRKCPFPVVENIVDQFTDTMRMEMGCFADDQVSWSMLQEMAMNRTGIEGVIIQARDGRMWKVKTKWYCDLHHSVTFTRYRDVARVVLADASDDLKAKFSLTGRDTAPIVAIEREIFTKINIAQNAAELHAGNGRALNRTAKDMALALREHALFGEIMRLFRGGEVDWLAWYLKNHINDHSLEVIPSAGMDDLVEEENV